MVLRVLRGNELDSRGARRLSLAPTRDSSASLASRSRASFVMDLVVITHTRVDSFAHARVSSSVTLASFDECVPRAEFAP